ncbi:hypothetical protein MIDIC_460009 [Alphaproteobacteria bacterium]
MARPESTGKIEQKKGILRQSEGGQSPEEIRERIEETQEVERQLAQLAKYGSVQDLLEEEDKKRNQKGKLEPSLFFNTMRLLADIIFPKSKEELRQVDEVVAQPKNKKATLQQNSNVSEIVAEEPKLYQTQKAPSLPWWRRVIQWITAPFRKTKTILTYTEVRKDTYKVQCSAQMLEKISKKYSEVYNSPQMQDMQVKARLEEILNLNPKFFAKTTEGRFIPNPETCVQTAKGLVIPSLKTKNFGLNLQKGKKGEQQENLLDSIRPPIDEAKIHELPLPTKRAELYNNDKQLLKEKDWVKWIATEKQGQNQNPPHK